MLSPSYAAAAALLLLRTVVAGCVVLWLVVVRGRLAVVAGVLLAVVVATTAVLLYTVGDFDFPSYRRGFLKAATDGRSRSHNKYHEEKLGVVQQQYYIATVHST